MLQGALVARGRAAQNKVLHPFQRPVTTTPRTVAVRGQLLPTQRQRGSKQGATARQDGSEQHVLQGCCDSSGCGRGGERAERTGVSRGCHSGCAMTRRLPSASSKDYWQRSQRRGECFLARSSHVIGKNKACHRQQARRLLASAPPGTSPLWSNLQRCVCRAAGRPPAESRMYWYQHLNRHRVWPRSLREPLWGFFHPSKQCGLVRAP